MKVFVALGLALAACTSTDLPSVASSPPAPAVFTPTPRSAAERTECARSVLTTFIDAFNRGDSAQLMTYFKTTHGPRSFKWFYTPATPAYGPSMTQLPDYFATWHATGERWRVVSLDIVAGPSWHGGIDFAIEIERAWPDRSTVSLGKGALDCDARTIFVFALG